MATTDSVKNDSQPQAFKTFPEFSKLTFNDRKHYEALIRDYPPISNYSFAGLKLWWDPLSSCAVSLLNDNLVISYWWPEFERMNGLSLIGTNKIDESICTIFDYQRAKGEVPKLVHVPEFVLSNLEYPEMFMLKSERGVDEYVYEVAKFYPIHNLTSFRRHRVKKFLSDISEERVILKSIDFSKAENQDLLLNCRWPKKGINNLGSIFDETWQSTITHADLLGLENVCLYIDGELHAYMLYLVPADKRYIIFRHAKVDYSVPRLFDYMVYAFARWLSDKGAVYFNLDSDVGLPFLRMLMIALGPVNYFRMYTVRPVG